MKYLLHRCEMNKRTQITQISRISAVSALFIEGFVYDEEIIQILKIKQNNGARRISITENVF